MPVTVNFANSCYLATTRKVHCTPCQWIVSWTCRFLRHINEISELKYRVKFLKLTFECFFNVDSIDLQSITLSNFEVEILTDCLKTSNRFIELNISNCLTEDSLVFFCYRVENHSGVISQWFSFYKSTDIRKLIGVNELHS